MKYLFVLFILAAFGQAAVADEADGPGPDSSPSSQRTLEWRARWYDQMANNAQKELDKNPNDENARKDAIDAVQKRDAMYKALDRLYGTSNSQAANGN